MSMLTITLAFALFSAQALAAPPAPPPLPVLWWSPSTGAPANSLRAAAAAGASGAVLSTPIASDTLATTFDTAKSIGLRVFAAPAETTLPAVDRWWRDARRSSAFGGCLLAWSNPADTARLAPVIAALRKADPRHPSVALLSITPGADGHLPADTLDALRRLARNAAPDAVLITFDGATPVARERLVRAIDDARSAVTGYGARLWCRLPAALPAESPMPLLELLAHGVAQVATDRLPIPGAAQAGPLAAALSNAYPVTAFESGLGAAGGERKPGTPVSVEGGAPVAVGFFLVGNFSYALIVNRSTSAAAITANFTVGRHVAEAFDAQTGQWSKLPAVLTVDGRCSVPRELPPGAGALYRW